MWNGHAGTFQTGKYKIFQHYLAALFQPLLALHPVKCHVTTTATFGPRLIFRVFLVEAPDVIGSVVIIEYSLVLTGKGLERPGWIY